MRLECSLLLLFAVILAAGCGRSEISPLEAASELLFEKDYAAALAKCDDVLKQSPDDTKALLLRGQVHEAAGDSAQALSDFTRVIQLEPKNPDGYYFRHKLYKELGESEKYMADYARYKQLDPAASVAYPNELNTAAPTLVSEVQEQEQRGDEASSDDPEDAIPAPWEVAQEDPIEVPAQEDVANAADEDDEEAEFLQRQKEQSERIRERDLAAEPVEEPELPPHLETPEIAPELDQPVAPPQVTRFDMATPRPISPNRDGRETPLGGRQTSARTTGIRSAPAETVASPRRERFSRSAPIGLSYPSSLPSTGIRGDAARASGYGSRSVGAVLGPRRTVTTGISSNGSPAGEGDSRRRFTAQTGPTPENQPATSPYLTPPRGTPILTMALPGTTIFQGGVRATNSTALTGPQLVPAPTDPNYAPLIPRATTGQSALVPLRQQQ